MADEPDIYPEVTLKAERMLVSGAPAREVEIFLRSKGLSKEHALAHTERLVERQRSDAQARAEDLRGEPKRRADGLMVTGVVFGLLGLTGEVVLVGTNSPLALCALGAVFFLPGLGDRFAVRKGDAP